EQNLSPAGDVDEQVEQTLAYWREWAGSCRYDGPYSNAVIRSALALKLMTFEPTGAIIASPTTSLPEALGGERNWDYRYVWLRDSTFTLLALLRVGYIGEARDFMAFIRRICSHHSRHKSPFQIMYGIEGETRLTEVAFDHLEGYGGSRPVRIGNAAYTQTQLDVYGEVLNCIHMFRLRGGFAHEGVSEMPGELLTIVTETVEWAARHWRNTDSGIWEVRAGRQHFVYSKVMCWVALDRGIKLAEAFRLSADLARWRSVRTQIKESILTEGFNERAGAFTQFYGSDDLDASALEIPLVGFLPVEDPRVQKTIDRIQASLTNNGMVYRYLSADGLTGSEATFSMCTFWLISCLALMGRKAEARERFEYMLSRANDVGLYAEEMDAATGVQLGNFPQAFTHISLINAASELDHG
ncbi:MAG: glycoside hydrolase family 15 protein, partial [Blastocatellia bacterium]